MPTAPADSGFAAHAAQYERGRAGAGRPVLQSVRGRCWRARPVALPLSSGQVADGPVGRALLQALGPVSGRLALLMDRAHEGNLTRRLAVEPACEPVVRPKSNRRLDLRRPALPPAQRVRTPLARSNASGRSSPATTNSR